MKKWIWIWAAAALVGCGRHLERVGSVDIVPEPSDVRVGEGVFSLTRRTEIRLSDGDSSLARAAGFFGELAGKSLGRPLAVVRGGGQESGAICVALGDLPAEAYVLSVRSDRIDLTGGSPAGVFYGFQTLRQMLPESALRGEKARAIDLPVVEIRDEPRIGYRALLLDAGRHFFGPEEVKSVIDLMAMHKLNRLQWHLTEDQGWRIEIRKYPELTRRGAWRDRSDLRPAEDGRPEKDPQPYGGYYTRQQVREIVRYAADRFIEIVPEIEMPGQCDGRAGVLSLARLSRRRLRGPLAVGRKGGRVLRGQGLDLRLSGGCADGGDRSVPLRACSHRRRRVSEGPLERVSPLPETHAGRGLGQRGGVAELFRAPDRALFGLEESADGRLGRDSSGRTVGDGHRCRRASASRGFVRRSKTATT